METQDILQAITRFADSISTIAVLVFAWYQDRKRADSLEAEIIADWKRQNDQLADAGSD